MARMTNGTMTNIHGSRVFRDINSLSTVIDGIQHDIAQRLDIDDDMQYIVEDVIDYLDWIKDNHG